MFNLFKRRRNTAPRDQAAAAEPPPASPSADDEGWQRWDGDAPSMPGADARTEGAASQPPGGVPPVPPDPPARPPQNPPPGPPPRGLALDEIARGMQHAAASANQLLAQQYTRVLDTFFDSDDEGVLTARTVNLALDAEHTMPVPLVALATPRGLALEKMVVHLTVRGDFAEAMPVDGGDHRARFHVTLAPPSKRSVDGSARDRDTEHIDIEMHFTALAPPDALMRVIDEYTHRLVPRPTRPARSTPTDEENPHA